MAYAEDLVPQGCPDLPHRPDLPRYFHGAVHQEALLASRRARVSSEPDERFEVTVRVSRSGALILIECESRDTTGKLAIPQRTLVQSRGSSSPDGAAAGQAMPAPGLSSVPA